MVQMTMASHYCGRFAPTPSGHLHFGSLVTAMASYCEALKNNGKWLIIIDDVDSPRVVKNSDREILSSLECLGFQWQENVRYQHQRLKRYQEYFNLLKEKELVYPCFCSRKVLSQRVKNNIYDGFCRKTPKFQNKNYSRQFSYRIINNMTSFCFTDSVQGKQVLEHDSIKEDFIIKRADQIFSYHFCFVVDCYLDRITHIVRGADLLTATAFQTYLQQQLGFLPLTYMHIPVICNEQGVKLSKSCHAEKVQANTQTLFRAASILGQKLDKKLANDTIENFWISLLKVWDYNRIPKQKNIQLK